MNMKKRNKGATKDELYGYSNENGPNESTCAKYQGWLLDGIKKYNQYFDAVKAERFSTLGPKFEDALLEYSIGCKEISNKKQKQENTVYETCCHELWDVPTSTKIDNGADSNVVDDEESSNKSVEIKQVAV